MGDKLLDEIRHDLDLILPAGSYSLRRQEGEAPVTLVWDKPLHENARRFSEAIVRLHNVEFRAVGAGPRRAGRKRKQPT